MAVGPVQLMVLGFHRPDFHAEVTAELARLRNNAMVRVIDSLLVSRDANGRLVTLEFNDGSDECDSHQCSTNERIEVGAVVAALIGRANERAASGVGEALEDSADGLLISVEPAWDVAEIPIGCAAALILLEHQWASPLRDAVARAGGFRIGDQYISPRDLAEIGFISAADEASGPAPKFADSASGSARELADSASGSARELADSADQSMATASLPSVPAAKSANAAGTSSRV